MAEPVRLRTLIAEDEPPARTTMRELLEEDPEIELVGEVHGTAVLTAVQEARPDLLLLDVKMPGMDGFEVLRRLEPEERPVVVFVTAHDEYALRAFDVRAQDYLLKPFSDDRFREALARAKERAREREVRGGAGGVAGPGPGHGRQAGPAEARLRIREGARILSIPAREITWIEASGVYVRIHTRTGRHHLVRHRMKALASRLRSAGFYRVHRSAIVNLDWVRELRTLDHGDGQVILADGTRIKVSRSRREGFEGAFFGEG